MRRESVPDAESAGPTGRSLGREINGELDLGERGAPGERVRETAIEGAATRYG